MTKKTDPKPAAAPKPKKDPTPSFDRGTALAALRESVNKDFKAQVLLQGNELTNVYALRRPFGIPNLDINTAGGLPAGGVSQIIGKDSVGKTYLANRIAANVQANYGHDTAISLAMTETRYDKSFGKLCGVRVAYSEEEIKDEARKLGRDLTAEELAYLRDQVGYIDFPQAATAEQLLEIVARQIESNLYQLVIVDSIGAFLTEAEAEAEGGITQRHFSGAAVAVTQFMHRVHRAIVIPDERGQANRTTILLINQYRDKVGAKPWQDPMSIQGGNALKHGKLVDILLTSFKHHVVEVSKNKKVCVGKEINWEIIKGKAGVHDGPRGAYQFYFGQEGYPFGVDVYEDLLVAGLTYGVIDQSGAWYSYNGQRLGQGKENVAVTLHKNPDLMEKIRAEVFDKAGVRYITREY